MRVRAATHWPLVPHVAAGVGCETHPPVNLGIMSHASTAIVGRLLVAAGVLVLVTWLVVVLVTGGTPPHGGGGGGASPGDAPCVYGAWSAWAPDNETCVPGDCVSMAVRTRAVLGGVCEPLVVRETDESTLLPCSSVVDVACGPEKCDDMPPSCFCSDLVTIDCCPEFQGNYYCANGSERNCASLCREYDVPCPPEICVPPA